MTPRRYIAITAIIVTAAVVEVAVLSRLGLPGATPDVVTISVVGLAFLLGPGPGAMAGFAAGMILDLAPPSDGVVGVTALVLAVVGYAAGSVTLPDSNPLIAAVLLAAGATAAVVLLQAAVGTFLGDPRVAWERVPLLMVTSAVYALVLSPVLMWVTWLVAGRVGTTDGVLPAR